MKNKKGFTLIELLTVIAILAVILIIAIPAILNVLEKAKKNAFIDSGISIVKSFEKGNAVSNILSNTGVTLPSNGNSISVSLSNINYENADDITGNIVIRNESGKYKYYLYITNGEYSICNKEYDKVQLEDVEKKEGCGISLYPTLTLVSTSSTTDSITITTSEEPGTISTTTTCVYGTSNTYGSACTSTSESESTITGLNPGTEYFFKICEVDSSNNEVSCVNGSKKTKSETSGEIEIAASWPNTTSMVLTLSGVTSTNSLEYRCVVGTQDTSWQSSDTCNITGLTSGTAYTVTAYVRDSGDTDNVINKTTTIYTARNAFVAATTSSGTCPSDTTTTVSGNETYDSVVLTGSCSQTNYTCNATKNSTANTNTLPETAEVSCSGVISTGTGGNVTSTSSVLSCGVAASNGNVATCGSRLATCTSGAYTLSLSQAYSSCRINYSSCNLSSTLTNSTGCGTTKTSTCNGTTKTMSSTCTSTSFSVGSSASSCLVSCENARSGCYNGSCPNTACVTQRDATCSSNYITCNSNCASSYEDLSTYNSISNSCYNSAYSAAYNAAYTAYSGCTANSPYPANCTMGSINWQTGYSTCMNNFKTYITTYSYSSSWISNRTVYYSSSNISSTSYDYFRTYTANSIVYSQEYTITYTSSQVNPNVSVY